MENLRRAWSVSEIFGIGSETRGMSPKKTKEGMTHVPRGVTETPNDMEHDLCSHIGHGRPMRTVDRPEILVESSIQTADPSTVDDESIIVEWKHAQGQ